MFRVTAIEGNRQRLDGGAMYGNVPRTLWEKWSPPDDLGRIGLATRGFLVEDGERKVLIETGIGSFFAPKLRERFGLTEDSHVLLESLGHHGIAPDEIDCVVLSHLHFDHAGGLLSGYVEGQAQHLLFQRARYLVSESAWRRAKEPHPRDRASFIPELIRLLEDSGRLDVVSLPDGALTFQKVTSVGERFSVAMSSGHTPGMLLVRLEGAMATATFCADLVPGIPWVHLPVTMGYDRAPERLIDEKAELYEELLRTAPEAGGAVLLFEHELGTPAARLVREESGRFAVSARFSGVLAWDLDASALPPRPEAPQGI